MTVKVDSFEVARRAGVSRATVSHVLNDRRDIPVAETTRQRVLHAAAELGYRPNGIARSLVTGRTRTLGVLVPGLSLNLVARLVNGIQDACDERDYRLLLAQGQGDPELERTQADHLLEQRVDGLICLPSRRRHEETARWLSRLVEQGAACVVVDERISVPSVDCLVCDDAAGAEAAVRHLAALGHHRIAHFSGDPSVRIGRERLEGYCRGLVRAGLPVDETLVVGRTFERDQVEQNFEQLLALSDPPTALFAANDYIAADLYRLAVRRGLRVPEDLAITGFGDVPMAAPLGVTTVSHPARELGRLAGQRLLARLADPKLPNEAIVLPTELVVRDTCGAAAPRPPS